ncbi:hypothetical protein LTR50_003859 [Elasticomyces elasticus]|nr:hypothetical protein LTR50_003859 [Elasticomyces elasticus]
MTAPNIQNVIIAGGSLAGLMHALPFLSLPDPPKVRILERSPTNLLHNQGAGVVAGSDTQGFFERYVRPGRPIAVTSRLRHYLAKDGSVIKGSVDEREQRMTSWDLLYHLLRWRVDGLKSAYVSSEHVEGEHGLGKASYEHGSTIIDVRDLGKEGVEVCWETKDGGEHTATTDLLIAADGASSTIRRLLLPDVHRTYAGYVAWRGTVPETQLSASAAEAFVEKFTFFHTQGCQILAYLIPGENGALEPGKRLANWVWYCNYEEGSEALDELMTDSGGRRHAVTLPVGGIRPGVWSRQKSLAHAILPPQFAELVQKTERPFVQAITDNVSPRNSFMGGKVLLVGDALAGFRPHTAASTGQAAFDATMLGRWLEGGVGEEDYDGQCMAFAREVQAQGVRLGERSQFGRHPLAG